MIFNWSADIPVRPFEAVAENGTRRAVQSSLGKARRVRRLSLALKRRADRDVRAPTLRFDNLSRLCFDAFKFILFKRLVERNTA